MKLLDMECAKCGHKISENCVKIDEPILRNAIGVLKEDGVYAFFLFLGFKKKTSTISYPLFEFLKNQPTLEITEINENHLQAIRERLSNNLNKLLFTKDLLERVMVYALYHLRAK